MLSADRTDARPQYKSYFEKIVVAKSKNADFVTTAKEKKCNVCHFGTKKSDRNDFGKALSKHATKAGYLEKKADAAVLQKYFEEALKIDPHCFPWGGGGGPSAYWRRRLHFQLEKEFPATDSRGGPREWSGCGCGCGCGLSLIHI